MSSQDDDRCRKVILSVEEIEHIVDQWLRDKYGDQLDFIPGLETDIDYPDMECLTRVSYVFYLKEETGGAE